MTSRASLERVRFVHGQRLPAADFTDAVDGELRRQELHVVAAHRAWGVAAGLAVSVGTQGARVRTGVAYDVYGRTILLRLPAIVPLPAQLATETDPVELVASWAARGPAVTFVPAGAARPGLDIALARFELSAGELGDPDLSVRHGVRSLAAPRIGSGKVSLTVPASSGGPRPFSATVDTSAAGFVGTPTYVLTTTVAQADAVTLAQQYVGPFVSVAEPTETDFAVQVHLFGEEGSFDLDVAWVGVEPPPTCPVLYTVKPIEVR
ncbi:MAG TPA: hypothetical protein VF327_04875 [Gaiellaceae bacterium]